ncbi:Uncharacterised protein [Mycobacterium tuberculosis]|uniref:Uncharacterized protein n=1 Tax=Mycobacterium tuberculosis TaxID=1773 RepID=A0A916LAE3_MYCTX|nr:Uncharacterised protein [Mycobacterium tuberculosis]COX73166.1 Uncharacterised protein [Mycobacterium tuberculosis]
MSRCCDKNSTIFSRPHVGQWCEANTTSVRSAKVSIASVR